MGLGASGRVGAPCSCPFVDVVEQHAFGNLACSRARAGHRHSGRFAAYRAEPPTAPAVYAPPPEWTVTVGVEPRAVPAWPGASDSRFGVSVLPLFSIRKAGTPPEFFGARDSFGFSILDLGQFHLGRSAS